MNNAVKVMNTYVPPIAITNSGWKFYILYVVWDAFGVLVIYLTFVETRGWSLEEIEDLFKAKSPVKASLEKKNVRVAQDGTITDVRALGTEGATDA